MKKTADIIIVGSGVGGLFSALHVPEDKKVCIITKETVDHSDSFLAQGGICVLKEESDYDSYYEDTMKAGHYENNPDSVEKMIRKSPEIIHELIEYGVDFEKDGDQFKYTREGAHSTNRILFHEDLTGKEITSKLYEAVKKRANIVIKENTTMIDFICTDNTCHGIVVEDSEGNQNPMYADYIILASGGVGGLFEHSTNFPHLTADALAICMEHDVCLENIHYVQIHPTTLYSKKAGRRFLISESVRGEGAYLLNAKMERFVDELLPRDVLTQKIREQMAKEGSKHVWLSVKHLGAEEIKNRFPNIYKKCLEEGYDITKEPIPVTPAQHYFMGGIKVDAHSKTTMERLYAVGETSCNGVHGANRLASNSLLESLVFAKEAVLDIMEHYENDEKQPEVAWGKYDNMRDLTRQRIRMVQQEMKKKRNFNFKEI